jgi:hypothetical protein
LPVHVFPDPQASVKPDEFKCRDVGNETTGVPSQSALAWGNFTMMVQGKFFALCVTGVWLCRAAVLPQFSDGCTATVSLKRLYIMDQSKLLIKEPFLTTKKPSLLKNKPSLVTNKGSLLSKKPSLLREKGSLAGEMVKSATDLTSLVSKECSLVSKEHSLASNQGLSVTKEGLLALSKPQIETRVSQNRSALCCFSFIMKPMNGSDSFGNSSQVFFLMRSIGGQYLGQKLAQFLKIFR